MKKYMTEKNRLKAIILILTKLIALFKLKLGIKKDYEAFREALGQRESGGDYEVVNSYGYLGKFQFGMARLCDLGYTERKKGTTNFHNSSFIWKAGYSEEYFLNNPDFQDKVFKQHIEQIKCVVLASFNHYLGKKVNGIDITMSGLCAGIHLGGGGGVRQFFQGRDLIDANGTKVKDYIKQFGGYF